MEKKQMVFIEVYPTIPTFKIARTLKLKKNYENILISFSKIDEKFFSKAFDKIIIFEIKDPIIPKNWIFISKLLFSRKKTEFYNEVKDLKPYISQTTGISILSFLANRRLFREYPRIYFAWDILGFYVKRLSLKKYSGRMNYINAKLEKICMKYSDGILHKGPKDELNLLSYASELNAPKMPSLIYCLDEWICHPKKNFNKELHIVYVGGIWKVWRGHISFFEIVEEITSRGIHFHVYTMQKEKNDIDKEMLQLEKNNKYFHLNPWISPDKLSEEISKFDFGIIADFMEESVINPLFYKNALANKVFTYIEAGLPVIMNEQFEYICSILDENGIGIKIKRSDLKILDKILKNVKPNILKKVKEAQQKLKIGKNIERYEKFYEQVHNLYFSNNL